MAVVGEVNQERVRVKLRRTPHRGLCLNDLLDVLNQRASLAAFVTQRVDYNAVCLSINFEIILGPVGRNFRRRIDHDVPVRKLPLALISTVHAAINDAPVFLRIDFELHRILLMIHDVHEDAPAVEVCVT